MGVYSKEIKILKSCSNRILQEKKFQFTKKEVELIKHAMEVAFDLTDEVEAVIVKCERIIKK